MTRLASLSIDLDALEHYHRLHALPPPPPGDDPVYGRALERFGEMCERLGLRATVFAVGKELAGEAPRRGLARLASAGHEVANHGHDHDYAITRRTPDAIADDLRRGAAAIEAAVGRAPVGHRAPGYTLSAPLLRALAAQGYRYDSSAFPAPPYWAAKGVVMALMALRGRPSAAVLDRPRALLAPRRPYRPSADEPYARGGLPILELPITTGLLGVPLVGTFVATLPEGLVRAALAGTRGLPHFNLEIHGVDLLDASDASPALAARQRDLTVPAARKIARLERFVRSLEREWVPLAEAATRLQAGVGAGPATAPGA